MASDKAWRVDRQTGTILEDTGGPCSVVVARAAIDVPGIDWPADQPHATRDAALGRLDYIVRAVNAHDALVEALERFVSTINNTGGIADPEDGDGVAADPEWLDLRDAYDAARTALALARGEVTQPAECPDPMCAAHAPRCVEHCACAAVTDDGLNHPDHGVATMPSEDMRTVRR